MTADGDCKSPLQVAAPPEASPYQRVLGFLAPRGDIERQASMFV